MPALSSTAPSAAAALQSFTQGFHLAAQTD